MSEDAERTFEKIRSEILVHPENLSVRQQGVDYLFIDRETPNWLRTNDVGKRIIDLCDGEKTVDAITDILASEYGLERNLIEAEITKFLYDAHFNGFLSSDGSSKSANLNIAEKTPENTNEEGVGSLWLHVTRSCNLKCPYCYYDAGAAVGGEGEIKLGDIESMLNEIKWKQEARIMITGGEPMLRKDIVDIAKLCSETGCSVSLLTNGTLKSDVICEKLSKLVNRIQISFDAAHPEIHNQLRGEGSFEKSVAAIDKLRDTGYPWIIVSFTPTIHNLSELPNMAKFAHDHGARTLHVNSFSLSGRARDDAAMAPDQDEYAKQVSKLYTSYSRLVGWLRGTKDEKYFKLGLNVAGEQVLKIASNFKRRSCGLGSDTVSIAADGSFYPCPALHDNKFAVGNIMQSKFSELYDNSVTKYAPISVDSLDKCNACDFKYFCGGGCRAHAFLLHGDLLDEDPHCSAYLETMEKRCWQLSVKGLPGKSDKQCDQL